MKIKFLQCLLALLLIVALTMLTACSGLQGPIGPQGEKGDDGENGKDGKSAYELAVEQGFEGTFDDWIASLVGENGEDGKSAYELAVEQGFEGTLDDWIASLQGKTELINLGNQFDNIFDKFGYINPYTGEEGHSDSLKYTSSYYKFSAGNLFFEATEATPSIVFIFYNENKEYIGYHAFSGLTSGICGWGFDGYFRCYVDKNYDGQVYFSSNVPQNPVDYSYKLTYTTEKQDRKLTIVNFGDSVFGNVNNATSISGALQGIRGDTVYNCGFGGTMMEVFANEPGWETFCFYSLVDAICTGDYSKQWEELNSGTWYPSDFYTKIRMMQTIDWNKVDVITIAYGTNDYYKSGVISGEPFNVNYYTGAFQYSVKRLQETYPQIRIIAITPIMRFVHGDINADDYNQSGNGTLREFATALKETSKLMRIPVIDAFSELPVSEFNREYYYQVDDGSHLNVRGRRMFAALISGYIDLYCRDILNAPIVDYEGD